MIMYHIPAVMYHEPILFYILSTVHHTLPIHESLLVSCGGQAY